jgi:hypothetical protein
MFLSKLCDCQGAQNTYIPRVPQCLFPRPNWDLLTPSPTRESACSPPSGTKEGVTFACGCGGGGPNSDDRWRKSLVLYLLCARSLSRLL